MRSLTIQTSDTRIVKGKKPEARCTNLAVRPEEVEETLGQRETIYVACERPLPDGGVEIQVFISNSANESDGISPVASFKAPPEPAFECPDGNHIVNFKYVAETNALSVVLAGGDIVVINLEDHLLAGQDKIEVVGSVEAGIKAAEWSPDEELLVIVTGEDNLVEMTKTFDVLAEAPLRTEEFGEDKPVNVGWGAQETQFHGSIGKEGREAVAGLPAATKLSQPGTSSQPRRTATSDDMTVRISWRGDGAFFVISTLFNLPQTNEHQRRLRFYSRTAVLQSTSEVTPGLEGTLAWQPSGSIIAASALDSSQIVFFERNGLRRYDFALKAERPEYDSVVRQLAWNVDSTILAVWMERRGVLDDDKRHCVQLWRRNNYHWYLKQTLYPSVRLCSSPERVMWHPEDPLALFVLASTSVGQSSMSWQIYASRRSIPHDSGNVAVVDGSRILLTPFRYQNIPPPMSSTVIDVPDGQTPVHLAFADTDDVLAALLPDGSLEAWRCSFSKGNKSKVTSLGRHKILDDNTRGSARQLAIAVREDAIHAVLLLQSGHDNHDKILEVTFSLLEGSNGPTFGETTKDLHSLYSVFVYRSTMYAQTVQGQILSTDGKDVAKLPEACSLIQGVAEAVFLGLSDTSKLYVNSKLVASSCSSFAIGGDFLVYTTLQHEARFVLLGGLIKSLQDGAPVVDYSHTLPKPGEINIAEGEKCEGSAKYARRVERGARIVTVVPSSMLVVLQMPRGNLETIAPRPLVLQVVRAHLDAKQYREAFLVCRRHRIDLNVLCDHDRNAFLNDLDLFVDQIENIDYLNLFVSGLKNENITQTMYASLTPEGASVPTNDSKKIDEICKRLRTLLEARDLVRFTNPILTTYACQRPPDLESALHVIARVKELARQAADEAIKYIIFLADANTLFNVALGIYDFDLVLAVAQNSQKDPREYVPFLRELRAYEKYYQRYKIDDHLNRFGRALRNLTLAGDDHFKEVIPYMQQHELYDEAVSMYSDRPDQLCTVLELRGDWLMKDNRCPEAGLSYVLAGLPRKAMVAYQKALMWTELFELAILEKLSTTEIGQLADSVATALRGKGRHADAGRVLLEYGRNVKDAVVALSEGGLFTEALRLTSLYSALDLVVEIVLPNALDCRDRLMEEASEISEQLEKQTSRLDELREKRLSDAANFYGRLMPTNGDDALDNVDMQTDAGTAATTQFTRYTAAAASTRAGTVKSGLSRKTAKKAMRKAATGAKGSIFEESYLLGSLARLVADNGRIATLVASTATLTRAIVRLSTCQSVKRALDGEESLLSRAKDLEDSVAALLDQANKSLGHVWDALGDAKVHDLDAALQAEAEQSQADLDVLKKPDRPKMANTGHWRVGLLSLLVQ